MLQTLCDRVMRQPHKWVASRDLYDGVLASFMGAVRIATKQHLDDDSGKEVRRRRGQRVHPIIVFLPCVLLYCFQMNMLVGVTLTVDPSTPVRNKDAIVEGLMFPVELGMWLLLQTISLKELFIVFDGLFKVWDLYCDRLDIKPPRFPLPSLLLCVIAKLMQGIVAFMSMRVGLTIILRSQEVEDIIFNGLVLTFIADLDELAFLFITQVFPVSLSEYTKFNARPRDMSGPCQKCSIICEGARDVIIFLCIAYIYTNQFMDFMLAVETNVLTAARDNCILIRWQENVKPRGFKESAWALLYDYSTPWVSVASVTKLIGKKPIGNFTFENVTIPAMTFAEHCIKGTDRSGKGGVEELMYSRLTSTEKKWLVSRNPELAVAWVCLLLIFVLPKFIIFGMQLSDCEVDQEDEHEDAGGYLLVEVEAPGSGRRHRARDLERL